MLNELVLMGQRLGRLNGDTEAVLTGFSETKRLIALVMLG